MKNYWKSNWFYGLILTILIIIITIKNETFEYIGWLGGIWGYIIIRYTFSSDDDEEKENKK